MQVSIKNNDGTYEVQAHLPGGVRVKMMVVPNKMPEVAPAVMVNQMLGGGGIRRLCANETVLREGVPIGN